MKQDLTNQFFDISRFPKGWGNIIFPISISRMALDQNAPTTFDFMKIFYPEKANENKIGVTIMYSDGLYQWKPVEEQITRRQLLEFMNEHRNSYKKLLDKNKALFQINAAFDFISWNNISLSANDFMDKYDKAFKLIKEDKVFLEYLEEDCKYYDRELTENQQNFFIEEIVTYYLITKMKVDFDNMFTLNREEWILIAYPGKPLKSQIYFHQKNIFDIKNTGNKFENCFYDLTSKKLYDFDRLDLETWNYE